VSARDGGPAFPVIQTELGTAGNAGDYTSFSNIYSTDGMTLRDYFAAKAMQAGHGINPHHTTFALRAKYAYEMADAMVAARCGGQS